MFHVLIFVIMKNLVFIVLCFCFFSCSQDASVVGGHQLDNSAVNRVKNADLVATLTFANSSTQTVVASTVDAIALTGGVIQTTLDKNLPTQGIFYCASVDVVHQNFGLCALATGLSNPICNQDHVTITSSGGNALTVGIQPSGLSLTSTYAIIEEMDGL
jgi:hypothetical protein